MNTEEEEERRQAVAWNLSSALVSEIQSLLLEATRNYNAGRIKQAYWYMKSVKLRFVQSLTDDERKDLKKKEIFFQKVSNGIIKPNTPNLKWDLCAIYENYNIAVMDLLNSYGYLIPTKKEATGL